MLYRELLTHTECCGAARRIWPWNCLTLEPFKILSHDFTLPLYVYGHLWHQWEQTWQQLPKLPNSPPASLQPPAVPGTSHQAPLHSPILCAACPQHLHGVKPSKQNFVPKATFLRKPRRDEESTSHKKHPSHRINRRLSLPSERDRRSHLSPTHTTALLA